MFLNQSQGVVDEESKMGVRGKGFHSACLEYPFTLHPSPIVGIHSSREMMV